MNFAKWLRLLGWPKEVCTENLLLIRIDFLKANATHAL